MPNAQSLLLGLVVSIVLASANLYLGMKVGLTFSAAIPASVLAISCLPCLGRGSTASSAVTVQSIACAAGTLPNVIFVLPALLMVGHWSGFPFWTTFVLCGTGGLLGVLAVRPVLPAMLADPALPFPEAHAVAEVLRLGRADTHSGDGVEPRTLLVAAVAAAGFATLSGSRLLASGGAVVLLAGGAVFSLGIDFSPALFGAGYLSGITVGAAMLVGFVLAWMIAVPIMTAAAGTTLQGGSWALADHVWSSQVRLIGAGVMAVGAVWTIISLRKLLYGILQAFTIRGRNRSWSPQDGDKRRFGPVGIVVVAAATLTATVVSFAMAAGGPPWPIAAVTIMLAVALGLVLVVPSGYIAGLVGTSSSPISSIALVALTSLASVASLGVAGGTAAALAFALVLTSAVMAMATMANGTVECAKTAALLGTPLGPQLVAVGIGVIVIACITPPVLQALYEANGLAGVLPRNNMDPARSLAAPQAALMATLGRGIVDGSADWPMLGLGTVVGVVVILADLVLRRHDRTLRLPVLAVGFGIYLPGSTTATIIVGTLFSLWIGCVLRRGASVLPTGLLQRRGTMLASGLIVGDSIVGVGITLVSATVPEAQVGSVGDLPDMITTFAGATLFLALVLTLPWLVIGRRALPFRTSDRSRTGTGSP